MILSQGKGSAHEIRWGLRELEIRRSEVFEHSSEVFFLQVFYIKFELYGVLRNSVALKNANARSAECFLRRGSRCKCIIQNSERFKA